MIVRFSNMLVYHLLNDAWAKEPPPLEGTIREEIPNPFHYFLFLPQPVFHRHAMSEFGTIVEDLVRQYSCLDFLVNVFRI